MPVSDEGVPVPARPLTTERRLRAQRCLRAQGAEGLRVRHGGDPPRAPRPRTALLDVHLLLQDLLPLALQHPHRFLLEVVDVLLVQRAHALLLVRLHLRDHGLERRQVVRERDAADGRPAALLLNLVDWLPGLLLEQLLDVFHAVLHERQLGTHSLLHEGPKHLELLRQQLPAGAGAVPPGIPALLPGGVRGVSRLAVAVLHAERAAEPHWHMVDGVIAHLLRRSLRLAQHGTAGVEGVLRQVSPRRPGPH
mmetsp:Transcript_74064/g.209123  ORF Transcript_74064/g.209123 Transcript_74064/m.209123 type:complete len:251 (+) Transcript_74064:1713-2465(+)